VCALAKLSAYIGVEISEFGGTKTVVIKRKSGPTKPRVSPTTKPAHTSQGFDTDAVHVNQTDYRERLQKEQEKLESELFNELRKEHDLREQEWRDAERTRIDQREKRLLEMLAERQARVEEEWQIRRKNESPSSALAWFSEQQKILREQLQAGMHSLREEISLREKTHAEEMRQELAQLERQWSEKRRKELQRLEVDWREQEIMHRERAFLRRIENEWRAEQKSTLEQVIAAWRAELQKAQQQELAVQINQALPGLFKQWIEQYSAEQENKAKASFRQIKSEWDGILRDTLKKEADQTVASIRKEVEQRVNTELSGSLEEIRSFCRDSLKSTQRDYTVLAQQWDKKNAEALRVYQEAWQSQLASNLQEMRTHLEGQMEKSVQKELKSNSCEVQRTCRKMGWNLQGYVK